MTLRAMFFDVGETLVNEERYWRAVADAADLGPHVVWAALGKTIERGEEHWELWGHLGIARPTARDELVYSKDDLYPDALDCLTRVRACGLVVGVAGNQSAALEAWTDPRGCPSTSSRAPRASGCESPTTGSSTARRADARPAGGGRLRRRPGRQRCPAGVGRGARRVPSPTGTMGASAGDARRRDRNRLSRRDPLTSRLRASGGRMSDLRIGLGVDAHAFGEGVPLVLGGVSLDHPQGLVGHSDGDVLAHALTDALLERRALRISERCSRRTTSATAAPIRSGFLPRPIARFAKPVSSSSTPTVS